MSAPQKQVQCFGRKRNAVAVALARSGKGHIRLNGQPLTLVEPSIMRVKAMEPLLLLKREHYANIDVRMRVKGGGQSAQVYAVRQALAKAIVAFAQKCEWRAWAANPPPPPSCAALVAAVVRWRLAALLCACAEGGTCCVCAARVRVHAHARCGHAAGPSPPPPLLLLPVTS